MNEYIYKMTKAMYQEIKDCIAEDVRHGRKEISVEEYITNNFGMLGKCVRVDVG